MTKDSFIAALASCAACYRGKVPDGPTIEAYFAVLGGHHENAVLFAMRQAPMRYPRFFPTAGQIGQIITEWYEERNETNAQVVHETCPYECKSTWISVVEIYEDHTTDTGRSKRIPIGYRNFDVRLKDNEKVKAWPCPHCRPELPSGRPNRLPPGVEFPPPVKPYRFTCADLEALAWLAQFGIIIHVDPKDCEPFVPVQFAEVAK